MNYEVRTNRPIPKALRAAPFALLLLGLLMPVSAGQPGNTRRTVTMDGTTEPAIFAIIGGALCLVSLKLRRRNR